MHLRSLGPKPSVLLLHYALIARRAVNAGAGERETLNLGSSLAVSSESGGLEGSCTLNPPADNGALCALSYEVRKWWEALVTLQFVTSDFV